MKLLNLVATLTAAGALVASSHATPADADEVRIRIAGQHPVDHHGTVVLNQIKEDLDAADVGLNVKLFPAGQLGNGEEVFGDVAKGAIDVGHTFVYSYNDPKLEINSVPYLVSNYEQMHKVVCSGSDSYRYFEALPDKQGIKLLGIFVEGFIGSGDVRQAGQPHHYRAKGCQHPRLECRSRQKHGYGHGLQHHYHELGRRGSCNPAGNS